MCAISGRPTSLATSQRDVERHDARGAGRMAPDPHLDADDDVAVGIGHLDGVERRHQAQLLALAHQDPVREGEDAGVRDVQVGQDAHRAALDHVLAEAGEVAGAGAAGIDGRGHARGAAELLRIDAERGAAPVDVGVQVDQARRDDAPRHVADVGGGAGLELRADARDLARREGHVRNGIEASATDRSPGRREG